MNSSSSNTAEILNLLAPDQQNIILRAATKIARLLSKTEHVEGALENLMNEILSLSAADEGSIQLVRPNSEVTRLSLVRTDKKKRSCSTVV